MTTLEEAAFTSVIRLHKEAEAERDEARGAARQLYIDILTKNAETLERNARQLARDLAWLTTTQLKEGDHLPPAKVGACAQEKT